MNVLCMHEQARDKRDSGSARPKGPKYIKMLRGPNSFTPFFILHENCK